MTNKTAQEILGYVPKFYQNEAVEIRFHSTRNNEMRYQLLATVSQSGAVVYTLHRIPTRSAYAISMSSLFSNPNPLPMKAYEGWQSDLLEWITASKNSHGQNIYEISEVL
jgi:hypothetical protein